MPSNGTNVALLLGPVEQLPLMCRLLLVVLLLMMLRRRLVILRLVLMLWNMGNSKILLVVVLLVRMVSPNLLPLVSRRPLVID